MPKRTTYRIDASNRLLIIRGRNEVIACCDFSINARNILAVRIKEPSAWKRNNAVPSQIRFSGQWNLTKEHDLALVVKKKPAQGRAEDTGSLIIKGEIIAIEDDTLVFGIRTVDHNQRLRFQILRLTGTWQANEENLLVFLAGKNASVGLLTLRAAWQVNRNQLLTYTYEKEDLKRKTKQTHTVIVKGFWQIDRDGVLSYLFSRDSRSRFDFRVALETPSIYPEQGEIKYRVGLGYSGNRRTHANIVTLYGTWKINRTAGLVFEMDYGRGRFQTITFGVEARLSQNDKIVFSLRNKKGDPLGMMLVYTRNLFKKQDAQFFLRLAASSRRLRSAETGIRIPF